MNWYITVLKKYAEFSGRARRKEYWMFILINAIISIILNTIGSVGLFMVGTTFGVVMSIIGLIYQLGVLIPSIAVGVRRIHDNGKSGWFILVPIYNLYLFIIDGNRGDNKYGTDPKAVV